MNTPDPAPAGGTPVFGEAAALHEPKTFPKPTPAAPAPAVAATIDQLTNAFLQWPLPNSVCADLCATKQGPGRVGTNLLSFAEAKQMFTALVAPVLAAKDAEIARLKEQEERWRDATTRLRDEMEHQAERAQGFYMDAEELRRQIVERTDDAEVAMKFQKKAEKERDALKAQVEILAAQREGALGGAAVLRVRLTDATATITDLRARLEQAQTLAGLRHQELCDRDIQLAAATAENERFTKMAVGLAVANCHEEIEELNAQLEKYRKTSKMTEAELATATAELAQVRQQRNEVLDTLEKVRAQEGET